MRCIPLLTLNLLNVNNFLTFDSCSDKELLESSVRFVQTFEEDVATLEIQQPKARDTGEYKCVVINTAGEDICTAKLSVTGTELWILRKKFSPVKTALVNYLNSD